MINKRLRPVLQPAIVPNDSIPYRESEFLISVIWLEVIYGPIELQHHRCATTRGVTALHRKLLEYCCLL